MRDLCRTRVRIPPSPYNAGWRSGPSRRLHTSKIAGSNPAPAIMLLNTKYKKAKKARLRRAFIFGLVAVIANFLNKRGGRSGKMVGQLIIIYSAAILDLWYNAYAIIDRDKSKE